MIKNAKEVKACPECGSKRIRRLLDKNQVVCKDCGIIFEPLTQEDEKRLEDVSDSV